MLVWEILWDLTRDPRYSSKRTSGFRKEYNKQSSNLAMDDDAYSRLNNYTYTCWFKRVAYALATTNNTHPGRYYRHRWQSTTREYVVRMIQWVQTAFKDDRPRLILVKSEALEMSYRQQFSYLIKTTVMLFFYSLRNR